MIDDVTVTEAVLNNLADELHATARSKGFWQEPEPFLAELNLKLILITSEVIEAHNVLRDRYDGETFMGLTPKQRDDFVEELMDIVIRTFDLAALMTNSPGSVLLAKAERNKQRPHKHNRAY